jgi:hypothetical protein
MEQKHIHIISFDVPYPANYGGVIDVFYKIKALHAKGVKVHLHCFEYGRAEALMLESICEKVYYYKRQMSKKYLLNTLPFVVVTRSSEKLVQTLLRDNYPILFEGLHCCFHLTDERLKDRKKIVRTHNIEHDYYKSLAKVEKSMFKKIYFEMEAKKLERFEKVLHETFCVIAISNKDTEELSARYKNVQHITAFHPNEKVLIKEGKGDFCLYHGNLEVGENNEAALYLVNEIFSKIKTPLIIAGRKPSVELREAVAKYHHIQLKANINTAEIDELIKDAQINILPTFQATGIKLKLLAALFNGRHCIVNTPMVANTGLEPLTTICNTKEIMLQTIEKKYNLAVDSNTKEIRTLILETNFSNKSNVLKIIDLI